MKLHVLFDGRIDDQPHDQQRQDENRHERDRPAVIRPAGDQEREVEILIQPESQGGGEHRARTHDDGAEQARQALVVRDRQDQDDGE